MGVVRIFSAVEWDDGRHALRLLDQRALPDEERYVLCEDVEAVAEAIENMTVRGAPAIGIAAAYGVVLGKDGVLASLQRLSRTRPTAVNLFAALDRMKRCWESGGDLLAEARRIHSEDIDANRSMGAHGAGLLPDVSVILTHCNAGALATGGHGTALGVLRSARDAGKTIKKVYADETRPLFQGSRLTAWELARDGFDVTVIADSMAGALMRKRRIDAVIVGADRIARNGDTANKIGTYGLSVLAKAHGVPFYVAAPSSTVDGGLADGSLIPIEERAEDEMRRLPGGRYVSKSLGENVNKALIKVWNPAFDVTPAENITAIITERGVHRFPYDLGGFN